MALGASPAVRRRVRAWEAFGLTTLGVCLAVPVGFLPAVAVRSQRDSGDPISFPWLTVLVLVAAAPAAAWAAGWLSARTGRRVELGVEA
ncbi:MAG: FtsX-like permease family protein [Acidimicrobiales bacterium]